MAGPTFVLWFFLLPETSPTNILVRRAARLRLKTNQDNIRSQTEIDRKGISAKDIAWDAVIKPCEIMVKDPAVLFTNVYTAITYGIYYSFFEAVSLSIPSERLFHTLNSADKPSSLSSTQ
jgi:MFS transporter, DHA1 family, multidrug resistance protein